MTKFFCTAGPVKPNDHYYVPPKLNNQEIQTLITQKKYFILHAPRQTGKTTAVSELIKKINQENQYTALYVNVEPAQADRNDIKHAMYTILKEFEEYAKAYIPEDKTLSLALAETIKNVETARSSSLKSFLQAWATKSSKPIILFIDEIDSLIGDTLISVLRQLRSGYKLRPDMFPQSLCLIGVRDVRDYRIWSDEKQAIVLGGCAFNIKAKSLRLTDFTLEDVQNLYAQHTQETGQKFTPEAIEYAFEQTQGQPWLVNALAYQACFRDIQDRTQQITKETLENAREELIKRRDTHLDVLIDRLQEDRVRTIIDAIITGDKKLSGIPTDDISYCIDLGLLSYHAKGLEIANPIYKEIIPRELTYSKQKGIVQETIWYQNPDKSLNMQKLFTEFTQFYREGFDAWIQSIAYQESGPHLLLMAFLQRIINGGGKIHREYELGRKRVDLLVTWPYEKAKTQRIVIELKIWYGEKAYQEGLEQTAQYMDTCNATEGHLVIFDRRENRSWEEKIYDTIEAYQDKKIHVWGM